MEDLDTFLARFAPFDGLDSAHLQQLTATAEQRAIKAGEAVLLEDGLPAGHLFVVLSGSIELVHQGELIQVLEPGECFGHPSLLSGMAPAFTVRAHEDSVCLTLTPEAARRVLATPAGVAYVATTMRQRLTRTGHVVHGLPEVGTAPVSSVARPALFCDPDTPIRDAARLMSADGRSALLVRAAGGLQLVSDAALRATVATGELSIDAPVSRVSSPALTVAPGQLALEATIDMLAAGVEHVAVVAAGEVVGIVAAADLMALDMRSPMALRHTINNASDEDAVVAAVSRLPQLFRLLLEAGLPPRDMGRVLSLQNDAATARLLDLAIARHGPAPVPWAWLVLGSAARREFTLASDQDNALAYANPPQHEEIDAYFARIGAEVNAGLARCGFGPDNNDVLAGNRTWRMSESEWLRVFDDCLRQPDESHLIRATVSFDFRHGAGGLAIAAPLTQRIRSAREHPDFIRRLARTGTDYPVALGFRERLAVPRRGPEAGKLDLKRQAVIPLVNLARFHALVNGITISPTLDRLDAAQASGGLDAETAEALREAFAIISRVRLEHHAAQIAAGQAPDNLIEPEELPPVAQADLREALRSVARAQKRLRVYVPPGI